MKKTLEKLVITDKDEINAIMRRRRKAQAEKDNFLPLKYEVFALHDILPNQNQGLIIDKKKVEPALDEAYDILHGFVEKMKFDEAKHDKLVERIAQQGYAFISTPQKLCRRRFVLCNNTIGKSIESYNVCIGDIRHSYYNDGLGCSIFESYLLDYLSYMPNKPFKVDTIKRAPLLHSFTKGKDVTFKEYWVSITIDVVDTRIVYKFDADVSFKSNRPNYDMPRMYYSVVSDEVLSEKKLKEFAYENMIACIEQHKTKLVETADIYSDVIDFIKHDMKKGK